MFRPKRAFVPALLVVLPVLAWAGARAREDARPDPAAAVAAMDWLAGDWSGSMWGGRFVAHYSTPENGRILSFSRLLKEEREAFYEFEVFEPRDGSLHLQPFPGGKRAGGFALTTLDAEGRKAVFENPDKDFPTRVVYERRSDAELVITLDDPHGGNDEVQRFELRREEG